MKTTPRIVILGLALCASVAAAFSVSTQPDAESVSAAVERPRAAAPVARSSRKAEPPASRLGVDRLQRDAAVVGEQNPFAQKSWFVEPAAPPAPPAAPSGAPPLPFTYVGRVDQDGGNWTIYLARGGEAFVVQRGDMLDGIYRVEDIEHGNLIIRYLPLNTRQTLQMGDAL